MQRNRQVDGFCAVKFPESEAVIISAPAPIPALKVMPLIVGGFKERHAHSVQRFIQLNLHRALRLRTRRLIGETLHRINFQAIAFESFFGQ